MYKALVRSHLDYCDNIYQIPAVNNQINLGVTLTSTMETGERTQYQAALAITGAFLCVFLSRDDDNPRRVN